MDYHNDFLLRHQNMSLRFKRQNDTCDLCSFMPDDEKEIGEEKQGRPLVNFAVSGEPSGTLQTTSHSNYFLPRNLTVSDIVRSDNSLSVAYESPKTGLKLTVVLETVPDTAVIRVRTAAENRGREPVDISFLSSAFLQGICLDGLRNVFDPGKVILHYCRQTWHGEGQWHTSSLAEMGLYDGSSIWCGCSASINSVGSFSTSKYVPVLIVEDTETSSFWYLQLETASNWNIEVGFSGSYADGSLYILADAANENVGGWHKTLQPGDRFTADTVAVGCLKGSLNDVIYQLTKYRRTLKPGYTGRELPVIFNDYMNCIWGAPSDDLLLPLIDRAADMGADIFCIDSGWFALPGKQWDGGLGDWLPCDERFGRYSLQGILDYIRQKGMQPGLWLEIEVCSDTAEFYQKPDRCFLMRNGKRVEGGMRGFLNFTDNEVRSHVLSIFERLIGMGVRFFKNDYNLSVGIGADNLSDSAADGLLQNVNAFYALLEEIRGKHPDVLLEGCASGGMRGDYKTLQYFHFNSSSDQVIYTRYPSIITGSLRNILPEQLGIWCYPWPSPVENVVCTDTLKSEEFAQTMADTEQTVYNIVNGMCGTMYLSGRVDCMDDKNLRILKEGIALYKKYRSFLHSAYPLIVAPHVLIGERHSWQAMGLIGEDRTRLLLAVWRNEHHDEIFDLDLGPMAGKELTVKQIFPTHIRDTAWYYNPLSTKLSVRIPKMYTARLFEISVKSGG